MAFNLNLILFFGTAVFGVAVLNTNLNAQESLVAKTFLVQNSAPPEPAPLKSWSLIEKIEEKEDELLAIPLKVGTRPAVFYENRNNGNGKISRKRLQDEEKEIALKILNTETGEVRIIKIETDIVKNKLNIISPAGYEIDAVVRSNGIRWNYWNTIYKISEPEGWIVIKNKYPERINSKKVEERIYSPYSDDVHKPEVVEAGREHLKQIADEAFRDLKDKNVYSKAVPGTLISDLEALNHNIFARLPLIEGMDYSEFQVNPQKSYERVLVLIGANKGKAYYWTESRAGARGWLQYTRKTYNNMAKAYPAAKLEKDHKIGASDHVNSMKAAILLHDYNLSQLVGKFGDRILADPRLEEYLAAAYNGNPTWTHNSLQATFSKGLPDWKDALSPNKQGRLGGLRNETKGYIEKIRYLKRNTLP